MRIFEPIYSHKSHDSSDDAPSCAQANADQSSSKSHSPIPSSKYEFYHSKFKNDADALLNKREFPLQQP